MKITAQGLISKSNTPFRKATVYLWPTNVASGNPFELNDTDPLFIDATNFSSWERGNPAIRHSPFEAGSTGYGSMYFTNYGSGDSPPKLHYPIISNNARKYNIYIRYKTSSSSLNINLLIDGDIVKNISQPVFSLNNWEIVSAEIVIPDRNKRFFSISVTTKDTHIDYICVVPNGGLPSEVEYSQYPYITLHAGIYEILYTEPGNLGPFYDAKSTYQDLQLDDQYNFDMQKFPGSLVDYSKDYAFSLYPVGSSDDSYIVWDISGEKIDPYISLQSFTSENGSEWESSDTRFSLSMWSFNDALDESGCIIRTPSAEDFVENTNKFDNLDNNPIFLNTEIQNDNGITNEVSLKLPDRVISLLVDQSGSMTWNDEPKTRYDILRRFINRLDATYPGEINYNLFSFESTPIRVNFFAVIENDQIDTSNGSSIANSFFADQESGYAGVRVVRNNLSFPSNAIDGDTVTEGFLDRSFDDNLQENQNYFYTIYSYDKFGTFSNGKKIKVVPRPRILPNGVGTFDAKILRGSGVRLDQNIIGLWHFNEASGSETYDFTENQYHMSVQNTDEPIWLNEEDVPVGRSGYRGNGSVFWKHNLLQNGSAISNGKSLTFMCWIMPFNRATDPGQYIFSEYSQSGSEGICLYLSNGELSILNGSVLGISATGALTENEWNHVAFTYDADINQIILYVNGQQIETGSFSNPVPNNSVDRISIGGNDISSPNYFGFFGRITEASLHDTVRSPSYIQSYSIPEGNGNKILDNGDRIIAFTYSVPSDYNYANGNIRIVEKEEAGPMLQDRVDNPQTGDFDLVDIGFGDVPYHENDGTVIYESTASPGSFFFTLSKNFIHGRKYHYKIFSQNAIGNYSIWSDSPVLSISIPLFESDEERTRAVGVRESLPVVQNIVSKAGNRKIYFQWQIPQLSDSAKEVKIYYSNSRFPIIDDLGNSEDDLIFRGNPDQTSFVHRNISNDQEAFYAFVTSDKYGYISSETYAQATPIEDADETGIPLLEVRKLRYEVVTSETISLAWDQPVIFQKSIEGWFDQRVALFAQITDEFGAPIADGSNLRFSTSGSVSGSGNIEDVFGENVNRDTTIPSFEESHILTTTSQGGGIIRGILRMSDNFDILSSLDSIDFSVFVSFDIPRRNDPSSNVFEFNSRPISIKLNNPFKMELINLRKDKVEHLCKADIDLNDVLTQSTGGLLISDQTKDFDGAYIRRQEPFIARVKISYRNQAIPNGGSVLVAVHDASDPDCDDDSVDPPVPFVPSFSDRKSRTVIPPSTTINLLLGQEERNGVITQFSYADIPLRVPSFPQGIMFFAKSSYNGFVGRRKLYIVFENILRIDLTVRTPSPDCVDIAEQFASAYLIDPDRPNIKRRIPDNEIVKWNLRRGISGKDRPFYSTDNVSQSGSGVFSRISNGQARRVFFGPACGVTWYIFNSQFGPQLLPELYTIRSDIVYDGLSAFDEKPAFIYPQQSQGGFGSRFLMHLNQYQVNMWADGYDYQKLTIWKDPNIAGGLFGNVFRDCADNFNGTLFILNTGQPVEIETGNNYEILHGPDLEIEIDPNINEPVFSNNKKDISFAVIPLEEGDTTEAFLRINTFVGPPEDSVGEKNTVLNQCESIDFKYIEKQSDNIIFGRTETELDGEIRYLSGGGDARTGVPPCILRLKEPLDIRIIQVRRNNTPVQELLVDGETSHTFIIKASFSDKPVPNGTPIRIFIGGKNPSKIQVPQQVIFTETRIDPLIDEVKEQSYASFTLLPMSPIQEFEAQIQAEINYDKRGDVERSMTSCVTIKYESQDDEDDDEKKSVVNNIYNGTLEIYDTVTGEWDTESRIMNHPRGALTLTWSFDSYGETLYAIGGLDGNSVCSYNEQYRIDSNTWTDMANMSVPRFYHTAVQDSGNIYVFGGFSIENNSIVVNRSCEKYDPYTDTWSPIQSMPIIDNNDFLSYGVAMGESVKIGNKVYIIGGIRRVGSQGSIEELNDRVVIYNIDTNEWSLSNRFSGLDLILYSRISPFVFYNESDNTIRVSGGAATIGEGQSQDIIFLTDTYKLDINTLTIVKDEQDYLDVPTPRYKGGTATVQDIAYFLGGATRKSSVSRILESIDPTSYPQPFVLTELADIDIARQSIGMDSDGFRYVYVAGGITSGRPPGFVQINASVKPRLIRLDGRQSAGVDIELINDVGERPTDDIKILVRGFVIFPDNEESEDSQGGGGDSDQQSAFDNISRSSLVYPVIFSSNDIVAVNGLASTVLLPRSEDILDKVDEIRRKLEIARQENNSIEQEDAFIINEGEIRQPYTIRVQLTIIDDFYYGQTVVDFNDNEDPDQTQDNGDGFEDSGQPPALPPPPEDPYSTKFDRCRSYAVTKQLPDTFNGDGSDIPSSGSSIGDDLLDKNNSVFDINPQQTPQKESPSASYYSDIGWVPQVIPHINTNNGTAEEALRVLDRLRNSVPFGASPFYDGLDKVSEVLLDDSLDDISKIIYVQTDNEESLSFVSLETALENIQSIDGRARVPVLINNFSVVFPVTLSALLARTDTNDLEKISSQTGGQSQTVLDARFINEILNNMIGRASGSIGFGSYETVIDLGQISVIDSISLDYNLFDNTDGNWTVSSSDDGFNYSEPSDQFGPNSEVDFFKLTGRYFKFRVALLSGLSASVIEDYENIATPGVPSLTGINIKYSIPKISFIYLNTDSSLFGAQQIGVAVDANNPTESEIQIGVATSNSSSWEDFKTGSRPAVNRYGKIFIPIRTKQVDVSLNEPLVSIDGFAWKTKYGSWDLTSKVIIRDYLGNIVDSSTYKSYPRQGLVVFGKKMTGSFSIDIENSDKFRIGIQIINRSSKEDVSIRGVGYMWNTNVFLPPPLSERPPEAISPRIVPSSPSVYTTISLTYRFFDLNGDKEDTERTQIRWYINGVEAEYLRDRREWNNINNILDPIWSFGFSFSPEDVPAGTSVEQFARERGDSLVKVGDIVYFTVLPSDGLNFGELIRSPSITIASSPPFITNISIRGRNTRGNIQDVVTTSTTAVAEFNYFDDGGDNESTIIWYVNGVEFKRGILNGSVNGLRNNEIIPGEISGSSLAMVIGNTLQVEIRPASGNTISDPVRSPLITVENSPPVVSNVIITPSNPSVDSGLDLNYTFFDNDIVQGAQSQQDESSIRWYRKRSNESSFSEVSSLANEGFVSASNTSARDQWYAEVVPFDGISVGVAVRSNTVTVQDA